MNMRLFSQSAPPILLNHILTWSVLPAKRFALNAEDITQLPDNLQAYVRPAEDTDSTYEVRINVPLTATRLYLRSVEQGYFRLLKSLRLDLNGMALCVKQRDSLAAFFEQRDFRNDAPWRHTAAGQKVMDDLTRLHQLHAEALSQFRYWQSARVQLWESPELWDPRDIYSVKERPDEMQPCMEQLQGHLLARIGLARRAVQAGVQEFGDTKVMTADGIAAVIKAFTDEGLRTEFDSMPLELSLERYLSD